MDDRIPVEVMHFLSQNHLVIQEKRHVFERIERILAPARGWLGASGFELSRKYSVQLFDVSEDAVENLKLYRPA